MSSFKRRQQKHVKKPYRVRNWSEYEAGLQRRGSLTVWLGFDVVIGGTSPGWNAPIRTKRKRGLSAPVKKGPPGGGEVINLNWFGAEDERRRKVIHCGSAVPTPLRLMSILLECGQRAIECVRMNRSIRHCDLQGARQTK